jgi:hypothetical protein
MSANRYEQIIDRLFFGNYKRGAREVTFERDEIPAIAKKLKIELPKNLGDVIYSFRYRVELPHKIATLAGKDEEWTIKPAGKGRYRFLLARKIRLLPSQDLARIKILEATPGIIARYALSDEQALLARLRYNRLIDTFLGITCYSLQNHLRTTAVDIGQLETDEVYIGLDRRGAHYVVPVQAKGGRDRMSVVQIEQDFAMCREKFADLVCRPVGAQFISGDVICLFEFDISDTGVAVRNERHYQLVPPDQLSAEELKRYQLPEAD